MARSAHAFKWSFLDTYANFFTKFVFVLVITRILAPKDYGLVAYMGLFLAVATWLSEGGFGSALIQRQGVTNRDFSTAFYFNIAVSLFFFLLYFFIAPYVADYFSEPDLKAVMRISSINIIVNSICYIHLIKLIKAVDFRPQAIINFSSSLASGIIGLVMALTGFHYWALIAQTLSGSVLRMAGLLIVVRWKPDLVFDKRSFTDLFSFGSRIFVLGLMESSFREINSLVIGKTYKTSSLGLYSRGQKFFDIFIIQPGIAFNKVIFPLFSENSVDDALHKRGYFRYYNLLFFILVPLCLMLFFISGPIVSVFLTEKWLGAVPFMKVYFLSGAAYIMLYFNSTTVMSYNRPGLCLKMDILQKTLLVIALVLTYRISMLAIVTGWLIAYLVDYIIYEIVMWRLGFRDLKKFSGMGQVLLGLIPMTLVHYAFTSLTSKSLLLLISEGFLMPVSYLLFFRLCRLPVYELFAENARKALPEKLTFLI